MNQDIKLGIIGLGYVGLPLAVAFGKVRDVVGYDVNQERISELQKGIDKTNEIDNKILDNTSVKFTNDEKSLDNCNFFIVTVPTPIDDNCNPDLSYLESASRLVGRHIKINSIIVYESTVYPGATEEICVPILEEISGLKFNDDFFVGYSPERINPGDKVHTLDKLVKVVSGSNKKTTNVINDLYKEIIHAGIHVAESIKVAEAAKVIENTQRDLNIALINELSLIFKKMDIDTYSVLDAAKTKWNFLDFRPGLVGGHCIGVDPYYLTFKAQQLKYKPEIILAGRKLNDSMAKNVSSFFIEALNKNDIDVTKSRILILGLTFKENCPDLRNSKVFDIVKELINNDINVDIYEPNVSMEDKIDLLGAMLNNNPQQNTYDGIILAVAHDEFSKLDPNEIVSWCKEKRVIYDLKNALPSFAKDISL